MGGTMGKSGKYKSAVGTSLLKAGLLARSLFLVTSCSQYNSPDDPRVKTVCAKILAENSTNAPLYGGAFRYMNRAAAANPRIQWPDDSSGGMCDGACIELVGHFGYTLYIYISKDEVDTLQGVDKSLQTKPLKEWSKIKTPGIYKVSPGARSECDAINYSDHYGRLPDACVLPEKVDDGDASKAGGLPIIVIDTLPQWLESPSNPPIGFKWAELIRVITPEGKTIFQARNPQMPYGIVSVGGCPGHLDSVAAEALYQSAAKGHL